ncbi:MAG: hypothetical protein NVS9B1_08750 [Candidatus Dormibacteraceae bacterium]
MSYGPSGWTVADDDGHSYASTSAALDQELHMGSLNAGEKVRGIIAFTVPLSSAALKVKTKFGVVAWTVAIS